MSARLIDIMTRTDHRGSLSVIETGRECPFPIERVFYLHGAPEGARRGEHAHRALHQMLVVVSGRIVVGIDDGAGMQEFRMESASVGLHIPPMHWTRLSDFSAGAVAIVLASAPFDEEDYILTFAEFEQLIRHRD